MRAEPSGRRRRASVLALACAAITTLSTPGAARALEFAGEAHGIPLPAYPSAEATATAGRYLDARAGRTSFAVVDSAGHVSGVRLHEHFETASVVKVMMLVAYLQMLSAGHRRLGAAMGGSGP